MNFIHISVYMSIPIAQFITPPTHLGTWREGRSHPPGPPGYGPAWPNAGSRAHSSQSSALSLARTHVYGHLDIDLTGRAKKQGREVLRALLCVWEGRAGQVSSPGAFSPSGVMAQWTLGPGPEARELGFLRVPP